MEEQIKEILAFMGTQMSVNEVVAREIRDLKRRVRELEEDDVAPEALPEWCEPPRVQVELRPGETFSDAIRRINEEQG